MTTRIRSGWQWLRSELQDDAANWQQRGVITSTLTAALDAWFWMATGLRLVVFVTLSTLYRAHDASVFKNDEDEPRWHVSPEVIPRLPRRVDGDLRVATCLLGAAGIAAVGIWPSLSFNSFESRLWIASQLWFLVLDPVWGVWYHARRSEDVEPHSAWRPITASCED